MGFATGSDGAGAGDWIRSVPFVISFLIVLHHYIKHRKNRKFSFIDKLMQVSDIDNHETWAIFFLGLGIGLHLSTIFDYSG